MYEACRDEMASDTRENEKVKSQRINAIILHINGGRVEEANI
jgi:hypothetical protein